MEKKLKKLDFLLEFYNPKTQNLDYVFLNIKNLGFKTHFDSPVYIYR